MPVFADVFPVIELLNHVPYKRNFGARNRTYLHLGCNKFAYSNCSFALRFLKMCSLDLPSIFNS